MRSILTTFLVLMAISLNAQKLPNEQQTSVRAPANIKVDGKATEWGDSYQAYNNTTGIFYSIANDNENLYLVIYSNNVDITNKILSNGINICFNTKKKSTDKSMLVKYPIGPKTREEMIEWNKTVNSKVNSADRQSADEMSSRLGLNKAIVSANKQVSVSGVEGLADTLFSIYDAKGLVVGLTCPGENLLCYELSIPLKYLAISPPASTKLNYNIRLNEHFLSSVLPPAAVSGTMPGGNDEGTVLYATDFWGEYTLAK